MLGRVLKAWAVFYSRVGLLLPFVAVLGALLTQACGAATEGAESEERVSSVALPATGPASFTIALPDYMMPQAVAVWSSQSLRLASRVVVRRSSNRFGRVVNIGTLPTDLQPDAQTGSLWTGKDISLGSGARIEGNLIAAGQVQKQPGVVVTGLTRPNTAITPLRESSWQVELPAQSLGDVSLEPGASRTLAPGGYRNASIKSRATLALSHGTYVFDHMTVEPQATLSVDDSAGPVIIYVNGSFTYRGAISDAGATPDERVDLLVVSRGTGQTTIEASFKGTVFAPKGKLYLGPLNGAVHFGAFFGKEVDVQPGTIVNHRAFPWSTVLPPTRVEWGDAPVVLKPSVGSNSETPSVVETTPAGPVKFTIPEDLWASTGNAGNGLADLTYRDPSGATVICRYRGGASTAHPTTDLDRAKGQRYLFVSCSNGLVGGSSATGTWFKLGIVSSDTHFPKTTIDAHLGGGCSGTLPPAMNPEEVVVLRDNFDWLTTDELAETDPDGRHALWHGLIYVERKEQLEALDRWRVKWSASPFSRTYLDRHAGKCGRVDHATDGKGVFVYAIFPAKLFNMIRNVSLEAKITNDPSYPPPFKVWLPSTPEDPEYVNSDGSLKYETLASSGYGQWLDLRAAQLPWFGEDLVDGITETVVDVAVWIDDNVIDPAVDYAEDGISYVGSLWDTFVDWAANGIDDIWETIQEGLATLFVTFGDHVKVTIELQMKSRDVNMPGWMLRTWGKPVPPGTNTGSRMLLPSRRPWLVPHGVQVRVRQWGWGFLPLMTEGTLPEDGSPVVMEVPEGEDAQDEDHVCFELESDAGSITSDLIPNEVCGFDNLGYAEFEHDVELNIESNQQDLHAMAQIVDSYDYSKTVLGHTPESVQVLTGFIANNLTAIINGGPLGPWNDEERAMALCLDFPSISQTSITALGAAIGPVGAVVAPLILKDIWWPDTGDSIDSRVMTHEYGHFLMCDMLYDEDGPSALTPLIARMLEGQNDHPDDTIAITTESWADTFSMQVVGAANYIEGEFVTEGKMKYCLNGGSCMDFNFRNDADYPIRNVRADDIAFCVANTEDSWFTDEEEKEEDCKNKFLFNDELARTESIIQDFFDRADSTNRETDNPWNGDVQATPGVFATSGYLGFADENVSLPGAAWRKWAKYWVENSFDVGPDVDPEGLLGALNDTAKDYGHNWCDRCEVFALHSTDRTIGGTGPAGADAAGAAAARPARWAACAQGHVKYFTDAPPDKYGNLSPSCEPCGPLEFADVTNNGACTACPAGEVPRGDDCDPCEDGTVPGPDNECIACSPFEISVGGVCTPCRYGEGADRATNTCKDCTPDAVLDWRTVANPLCSSTVTDLLVPIVESPNDTCPGDTWVEVNHLDVFLGESRDELRVDALPDRYFSPPSGGFEEVIDLISCPLYDTHVRAHKLNAPTDLMAWEAFAWGDGLGVWGSCINYPWCDGLEGETCNWTSNLTINDTQIAASSNRIRLFAAANRSGVRKPVRLVFTAGRPNNIGCEVP
jgi:hypothetical protein